MQPDKREWFGKIFNEHFDRGRGRSVNSSTGWTAQSLCEAMNQALAADGHKKGLGIGPDQVRKNWRKGNNGPQTPERRMALLASFGLLRRDTLTPDQRHWRWELAWLMDYQPSHDEDCLPAKLREGWPWSAPVVLQDKHSLVPDAVEPLQTSPPAELLPSEALQTTAQRRLAELLADKVSAENFALKQFWVALEVAGIRKPAGLAEFLALCDGEAGAIDLITAIASVVKQMNWQARADSSPLGTADMARDLVTALTLATLEQRLAKHPLLGTLALAGFLQVPVKGLLPAAVIAAYKLDTGLKIVRHAQDDKLVAANVISDTSAQTFRFKSAKMAHEAEVWACLQADGAIDLAKRQQALHGLASDLPPETADIKSQHKDFAKRHGARLMFAEVAGANGALSGDAGLRQFLNEALDVPCFAHQPQPDADDWLRLGSTLRLGLAAVFGELYPSAPPAA